MRRSNQKSKENPMNNEIQRFDFKGAALRTLTDEAGEPWFVAKDACDILGIDTNHLREALDDDEITNLRNSEVWNQPGRAPLIISEPGLYKLIMRSRKPEAKEFQRWVTHEVLPQIRRTGGYIPAGDSDSDEDIMARAVLVAQKTIKQKNQQIASQQSRIVELEPKARFADAVAASDGTCLVGELAKMLRQNGMDIGQNRLFRLLQADGYLGKSGSNRNVPTQRAMDLGLFRIKETTVTHADGHTTVSRTPKVTGKGQRYFIDRYWGRAQPSLEAGA
jgi:anti-repressor protein